MKHRTLKQYIRQMYLPRLIIPFVVLVILIIILIVNPLKDHIKPYTIANLSSLDTLYDSNTHDVTYTADTLYYTGVNYQVNDKTAAKIYYTIEDNRCYLFLICEDELSANYDTLTDFAVKAHLTHNDNMYQTVIATLSEELKFAESMLVDITSPTFVNQYAYVHSFDTFSIYGLAALTVLVLIDVILTSIVFLNPQLSVLFIKLRKYGRPKTAYSLVEQEFNEGSVMFSENIFISDTFFFGMTRMGKIAIIPLENIVWVYKYNEFVNHNGKANIQCPLCIVTQNKIFTKIPHVPEDVSDEIISHLQNRFPEIMVGNEKGTL